MCHRKVTTRYNCGHRLVDPAHPRHRQIVRCHKYRDHSTRNIPAGHMAADEHVRAIVDCEPCENRQIENTAFMMAAGGIVSDEVAARQRGGPVNSVSMLRRTQADRDAAEVTLAPMAPAPADVAHPAVATPSGYGAPPQPARPYFLDGQNYGYGPTTTIVDLGRVPSGPIEPALVGPSGPENPYAVQRPQGPIVRPIQAIPVIRPIQEALADRSIQDVEMTYADEYDLYRDPTPEAQQVSTHATTNTNATTHTAAPITIFPNLAGPYPSYYAAAPLDLPVPDAVADYRAQIDQLRVQEENRRRREAETEAAGRVGRGGSGRRSGNAQGGSGHGGNGSGHRSGHGGGSGAGSSGSKSKRH